MFLVNDLFADLEEIDRVISTSGFSVRDLVTGIWYIGIMLASGAKFGTLCNTGKV